MQALLLPSCSRANTKVAVEGVREPAVNTKQESQGQLGSLPLSVKPGEEEQEGGRLRRTMANLEGKFQLGFHV